MSLIGFILDVGFIGNLVKTHWNVIMELTGAAVLSCVESARRQGLDLVDHTVTTIKFQRENGFCRDRARSSLLLLAMPVG